MIFLYWLCTALSSLIRLTRELVSGILICFVLSNVLRLKLCENQSAILVYMDILLIMFRGISHIFSLLIKKMKYKFTTAQYIDIPDLLDLEYLVYTWDGMSEKEFKLFIYKGDLIVCKYKDKLIGYIAFNTKKSTTSIISVVMHPEFRRRGISRDLLDFAHETNTKKVIAIVPDILLDAHLFFKACNFTCDKIIEDYFDSGVNGYRFVRPH